MMRGSLPRRRSLRTVFAAVMAATLVALPVAADQGEDGTRNCPGDQGRLHARYKDESSLIAPGGSSWIDSYENDNAWHVRNVTGPVGGGDWVAWGIPLLDFDNTYAFCLDS